MTATKKLKRGKEVVEARTIAEVVDDVVAGGFDDGGDNGGGGGFLTPDAFAEWTKPRDEHGTCYAWYVDGRTLRRAANRRGGGSGEGMDSQDWLFKAVMDGKPADEAFGNDFVEKVRHQASYIGKLEQFWLRCVTWGEDFRRVYGHLLQAALLKAARAGYEVQPRDQVVIRVLQDGDDLKTVLEELGVDSEAVADRAKTREVELSELLNTREMVAYRIAIKGEDPEAVFGSLGEDKILRTDVESRLKCRPLTAEELARVVRCDGSPVECATCGATFQPIVAHKILRDLTKATTGKLDDSYFAGNRNGPFTAGAYRNFYDTEGMLMPMPFHGPYLPVGEEHFSGQNCLLEARRKFAKDGDGELILGKNREPIELDGLEFSYGHKEASELAERENAPIRQSVKVCERFAELRARRPATLLGGGVQRDFRPRRKGNFQSEQKGKKFERDFKQCYPKRELEEGEEE